MTSALLKWFVQATAKSSGLTREGYVRLFYPDISDIQGRIGDIFSSNNSRQLFAPAIKSSSTWQSLTLPAASAIRQDPSPTASRLSAQCGDDYFDGLKGLKALAEADLPELSSHGGYADSRLKTWLSLLEICDERDKAAVAAANIFAELALWDAQGFPAADGGSLLLDSLTASRGSNREDKNNIYMTALGESADSEGISARLDGASCVKLLGLTASPFDGGGRGEQHSLLTECLKRGIIFQVILPKPDSYCEIDGGTTKAAETYPGMTGLDAIRQSRNRLIKAMAAMEGGDAKPVRLRYTGSAMPYAMMIVTYDGDRAKDFVKVDLYSPYLEWEADRRSFCVYRERDPDNFAFFEKSFAGVWSRAESAEQIPLK